MVTAIANGDSDVATYFENMYPTLKSIVDGWNFNIAFDANTDDLQGKVQNVLDELKDENGRSFTAEEILGLGESNAQYQALVAIAHTYNMTIEEMIELLKKRNLVSTMDYQGLVGLFGQDNVDKLSPEDLEIAYTIKNVGNVTFEQLQAEIQKAKEATNELPKSFTQAWSDLLASEDEDAKKLGETLLDLAEKGRLTTQAFNEADSTGYFKNLSISADEAVSKINKLVDESQQLSSMSSQLSKISEALASKRDDGFVSADTLSGFDAEIRGLDSWDRFQEVLGNVNSLYNDCQKAANTLASEWVNSNEFLVQLTEQNKEYYATQLKAMGVENYQEIIEYAENLNIAKEALTLASFDLATATAEEVEELINEGTYSDLAQQQIWNLILAKQTAEGTNLDTANDCQRLLNLAQNAGVTGKAIELLTELMSVYNNLEHGVYGTNKDVLDGIKTKAEAIKQNITNLLSDNANQTFELKPKLKLSPSTKAAAKKAGKETGKSYLDGLKSELSKMNSIISYASKLLGKKITSYGKQKDNAIKDLEAQKEAAKKSYEAQKDAANAAADAQKDALDSQKEGFESQKDAIQGNIDAKQAEIDKINEAIKARKDELDLQEAQYDLARKQNQKPKLMYSSDKGLHYVQDTSGIRDAKEKILENKNNKTIASIEKEIDALEDAIDAVDRQIEALDKQADAIEEQADAASDYFDTLMEESDDYYDRLIEDTEAYWDSLINGLEEYQTRWEELADLEEEAKMNAALKELNITTEDILNMSEEDFESFKQRYLAILTEIYAGNEEVQAALQEASGISVESLQSLIEELRNTKFATDEYSESADNAKTGSSEWSVELDNTSTSADEATASVNNLTESTNNLTASADNATVSAGNLNTELINPPSTEGYDAVADALSRIKSVADAVSESVRNAIEKVNTLFQMKEPVNLGANLATNVANKVVTGKAYASGTKASGLEHDEENALRSEHGQKELAVYPDGTTELTESPVMSDLPKGTVIYNEEQTEKILDNKAVPVGKAFAKGTDDGIWTTLADGSRVRDLQPGDKMYDLCQKYDAYLKRINYNLDMLIPNSFYEHNRQMEEMANQINYVSSITNNNRNVQQPVNQVFNITMPNVTDATTATELMNDLQSLSRKKFQVDWDK